MDQHVSMREQEKILKRIQEVGYRCAPSNGLYPSSLSLSLSNTTHTLSRYVTQAQAIIAHAKGDGRERNGSGSSSYRDCYNFHYKRVSMRVGHLKGNYENETTKSCFAARNVFSKAIIWKLWQSVIQTRDLLFNSLLPLPLDLWPVKLLHDHKLWL